MCKLGLWPQECCRSMGRGWTVQSVLQLQDHTCVEEKLWKQIMTYTENQFQVDSVFESLSHETQSF